MKTGVLALILITCGTAWAAPPAKPAANVKLENERVRVTELTYAPGAARAKSVRAHDQVIVFMDDCRYQRTDPVTGEKTIRARKSGDVIWHSKGEAAPLLVNVGSKPYRTMVIEILR